VTVDVCVFEPVIVVEVLGVFDEVWVAVRERVEVVVAVDIIEVEGVAPELKVVVGVSVEVDVPVCDTV
jgi:hypothetical protein